jgi:S-DNA-T family DNA segregation ATPase FtsK/SpoIIIE
MENGVKNPVVENWLGKFGALLSNQFIYEWFGIASFLFVLIFFVIGYRLLFRVSLFAVGKTLAYSLFFIIFISVSLGFFHAFIADTPNYLEGNFGYWSNRLLDAQVGQTGTAGILVFAALTILVIAYNIDFKLPKRAERELATEPVAGTEPELAEAEEEEIPLPLEWAGGRAK